MRTESTRGKLLLRLGSVVLLALSLLVVGIALAGDKADLLVEGDRHFKEKSYRKSFEAYEKLLKGDPDHAEWFRISLRMGHCQAQLGNHDKAEKALTDLADREGLTELQRARAEYRLGHYFFERPHYYYENSKKVKAWGRWIADSRYHRTERKDIERAKNRLKSAFDRFEPIAARQLKALAANGQESVDAVDEAFNAGLDAAAALQNWQYQHGQKRKSIDYLDDNGQKKTFYYYTYEFKDRDEILKQHDRLVELANDLGDAARSLLVQARGFPPGVLKAAGKAKKRSHEMAALATYRKGSFLVALTQIDDYYTRNLLYHPDLEDRNPLDGKYSPIPVLRKVYQSYHDTPYADDAQYFVGYCYQQVGEHVRAVKAYTILIDDADFKDSTERSSALYNRQQILAQRLKVRTIAKDREIKADKLVRKWSNYASWNYRRNVGTDRSLFKKGETLGLWVESRNVKEFTVRVLTFDVSALMKDGEFLNAETRGFSNIGDPKLKKVIDRHLGETVFSKDYVTGDDGLHRFTQMTFQLPETLPFGGYVLEVDCSGLVDRRLVVVSDAQLVVQTYNPLENLAIFVDSETGAPLKGTRLIYKRWDYYWKNDTSHYRIDVSRYAADRQGRTRLPAAGNDWDGYLLFAEAGGRYAFIQSGFPWWQRRGWNDYSTRDTRMYPVTDRPVYRPGDDVHLKVILRQRDGGEWNNVKGAMFQIEIRNAKGEEKLKKRVRASRFGALEVDLKLKSDASLGSWHFYVRSGSGNWIGSGYFQVEEYKKPEFEVKVAPPDRPVKIGQAISATISSEYYFGGPVSGAEVSYKVYRSFYFHRVYFPRRFDWLYNWQTPIWSGTPDQQFHRNSRRELIREGKGKLDENGELVIEWNTSKALADWPEYDHRYIIEASVTDASRRTINGSGSVKALRRAFFAFVDNKLGYYRPGDKLDIEVRTVTADNKPVRAEGKLDVYRIKFEKRTDADGMTQIDELATHLRTLDLNTDERGLAFFTEAWTESGTFDLIYRTKDEWGTEISGKTRILVKSDEWIPGSYRFSRISLIPQKRVYIQGEVAKILLASDFKDAWMLISVMGGNEVISQTFTALTDFGGQLELELTVGREHLPNFHINVLTIQNGELHTHSVELFVPPVDQFLDVQITSDKDWYLPGEKGKITVTAKDNKGRPVVAEFAVSIYDRSITYIMADRTPNIVKHFYGDRRSYRLNYVNSYNTGVGNQLRDIQKYKKYRWYGAPLGWGVRDWIKWEKNSFDFENDGKKSDKFAEGFKSRRSRSKNAGGDPEDSSGADDEEMDGEVAEGGLRRLRDLGENGAELKRKSVGGGGAAGGRNAPVTPPPPEPSPKEATSTISLAERLNKDLKKVAEAQGTVAPRIRSNFKDSVFYSHSVTTGPDGKATIEIEFPDNLTEWRVTARGITAKAKVGEAFDGIKVRKKLILRDQAPRFFVEGDVVTLSAIIMNRYAQDLEVKAMLIGNPSESAGDSDRAGFCEFRLFPETPDVQTITVAAKSEVRVDWQVKMVRAGLFKIRMLALTNVESDATERTYTCKVRGAEMYQATTAVIGDDENSASFTVELPDKLDPAQTNLDLMLSPSVAALAMDAIPYLLQFPYGCVEQTMSRFIPAVTVRKTLKDAGISLEEVGKRRAAMDYAGIPPQAAYWYKHSPVFDTATMDRIIDAGMARIKRFQHGDGGWGWWRGGLSDTYMSAYVVYGLVTAKQAEVQFDARMLTRGVKFLQAQARKEKNLHRAAYIAYVLSYAGDPDKELLDKVYDRRDDLTHLSRSMICMAEWLAGDTERARILISNIEDYRQEDLKNGTVWWYGGKQYWNWWNDKIETNAFVMQAFVMVEPQNKFLEKHVRWLAQNRKGSRWNSTKDTAHAVNALMAYAKASGELSRRYSVTVSMDNKTIHTWDVTPQNIFSMQTNLRLTGDQLKPGKHTFTVTRQGEGKVYFSSFLSYFSKEDHLKASGNQIHIDRKYYKLTEKVIEVTVKKRMPDGSIKEIKENRLTHERTLLANGAKLVSGDIIEVELNLTADNDYEYLAFEDFKPAGCEPVALRSGRGYGGGLIQNVELRDDRVAFFVSYMPQGTARLKYQLRCEIPGTFSALPTQGGSMYVPEVRANSEEFTLTITDK